MFCGGCGEPLSVIDRYCGWCGSLSPGAGLHLILSTLDAPAGVPAPFCPTCGLVMASRDRFCSDCGVSLDGGTRRGRQLMPAVTGAMALASPGERLQAAVIDAAILYAVWALGASVWVTLTEIRGVAFIGLLVFLYQW